MDGQYFGIVLNILLSKSVVVLKLPPGVDQEIVLDWGEIASELAFHELYDLHFGGDGVSESRAIRLYSPH